MKKRRTNAVQPPLLGINFPKKNFPSLNLTLNFWKAHELKGKSQNDAIAITIALWLIYRRLEYPLFEVITTNMAE